MTLHHYETLYFDVARDHASSLWEITLRCCSHYIRISIIQPAVTFYRRYEWTAEVYSFSRPFFFQLFFLAIKNPRPILLSATSSPLSPVYSYGAYASLPFFILYNSMLREITLRCYERLQIIVARDYTSVLREITIHHCEISRFIIARYHASSLREITLRCYSHYIRISIIQSAVTFYRRYEWTAEVYSFSRSLDLSFFNSSFWR